MAICQTRERAAALSYTLCTKQRGRSHQRPASRTLLLYLGRQLLHTNGEVAPVGVEEGAVMVPHSSGITRFSAEVSLRFLLAGCGHGLGAIK